jgi:hypothetical protein
MYFVISPNSNIGHGESPNIAVEDLRHMDYELRSLSDLVFYKAQKIDVILQEVTQVEVVKATKKN